MPDNPTVTPGQAGEPERTSGADGTLLLQQFHSLASLAAAVKDGNVTICVAPGYIPLPRHTGAEIFQFPSVTLGTTLERLEQVSRRLEELSRTDTVVATECSLIARELVGLRQDMAELFGEVKSLRQEDLLAARVQAAADQTNLAETRTRLESLEEHNRAVAEGQHGES